MALSISQRPSIQYHPTCQLAPDPCIHLLVAQTPAIVSHIYYFSFLKFKPLFDQMCFKPFDYNGIFQYSVKWNINDLEINSTNKIDFQRKCGLR